LALLHRVSDEQKVKPGDFTKAQVSCFADLTVPASPGSRPSRSHVSCEQAIAYSGRGGSWANPDWDDTGRRRIGL